MDDRGTPGLLDVRQWAVWRAKPWLILYLVVCCLAAFIIPLTTVHIETPNAKDWWQLAGLIALAAAVTEGSRRTERIRLMLGGDATSQTDLCNVWQVAGALLLPISFLLALTAVVYALVIFRGSRTIAESVPYRILGTASCSLLAAYAMHFVLASGDAPSIENSHFTLAYSLLLVAAIGAHFLAGLVFALPPTIARGASIRTLATNWFDHCLELATEGLGLVVAVLFAVMPLLTLVAVPILMLLERSVLVSDLAAPALNDGKTGLLNVATWRQLAEKAVSLAQRDHAHASLLMIDLDRFKTVNDTHGHLVGDLVLHAVAGRLQAALRDYDVIGRFGGEEFVALLPGTTAEVAITVAERIRTGVEDLRVPIEGGRVLGGLSVSIGVSVLSPDARTVDDLLSVGDTALYRAKRNGRNRIELGDACEPTGTRSDLTANTSTTS